LEYVDLISESHEVLERISDQLVQRAVGIDFYLVQSALNGFVHLLIRALNDKAVLQLQFRVKRNNLFHQTVRAINLIKLQQRRVDLKPSWFNNLDFVFFHRSL